MDKILELILNDYIKVIKINSEDKTFDVIKVSEYEKVQYSGINQWFINFANSNLLYEADKKKFLEFANLGTIKDKLRTKDKISFLYRRKTPTGEVKWMKMSCAYVNEKEILLTVRDISMSSSDALNDIKDYKKEFANLEESHAAIGFVMLEYNIEDTKKINEILDEYYRNCYDIINYDDNHYIIYVLDKTRQECFPLLAQFYKRFKNMNVSIGHVWEEDDWDFYSLLAKTTANLQINKTKEED